MSRRKPKHLAKSKSTLKIKKTLYILLEAIFITIAVISIIKITQWIKENKQSQEILNEIAKDVSVETTSSQENGSTEKDNRLVIDFESLKKKNPDIVSYIKIENTNIEYPIVKGKDNDFYLNHSFDKKYNSAGWIFMDYRDKGDSTDKNIVIYGHNRKDTSMFGTLRYVFEKNWYENEKNLNITYISENEYSKYQIFSAYRIEAEDYYITTNFKSDNEFKQFINKIKSRSFKNFNIDVTEEDQILTLSTCSNNGYRVAVHAKKIR